MNAAQIESVETITPVRMVVVYLRCPMNASAPKILNLSVALMVALIATPVSRDAKRSRSTIWGAA